MNKIDLDELRENMQHFLKFHDVEDAVERKIKELTESILLTTTMNGGRPSEDVLYDYLGSDDREQNRLKAIIALSGGSLEKLKRIVEFWFDKTIGRLRTNQEMRKKVAKFLNNPDA
ncbi:MAG: hypothetical protein OXG15_09870 [Gammaproteobacteria bacterium]|nr:hypothetical protein [Gammaproteobacteria bacterium]